MHYWGWQSGDWWVMGIGMVFWLLLVVGVVWLIVRGLGSVRQGPSGETAEEALRRRFAAGEIDADEYEHRLQVLRRR